MNRYKGIKTQAIHVYTSLHHYEWEQVEEDRTAYTWIYGQFPGY